MRLPELRPNPFRDEQTLVFWYDMARRSVEEYNADWREQSHWVNNNVPDFRTGRADRNQRPWLAIRAAYEAALQRIEELERRIMHRSTIANTGVEVYIKTTNPLCECSGHDIDINRGHEFDSADNGSTIKTNDTAEGGSVITN